jgi:transposase
MTVCVIDKTTRETFGRKLSCEASEEIVQFFRDLGEFEAVMEATATYEWLWEILEPMARRLVLAHPKKLRIIAESMKKTDKHDAYLLAWLLSQDSIPEAHRPSPRQRQYQHLVRHRVSLVRQRVRIQLQVKSIFAARNINARGLFRKVDPRDLAKCIWEIKMANRG